MRTILLISLIFFLTVPVYPADSPGTTGFQFLRTQVGARPAALGGAFLAVSGDANALHYNPAGIATLDKRGATFTYLNDLLDFNTGFVGVVQPGIGPGHMGLGVLYKDYGNFKKTDLQGQEIGQFNANSISIALTYAVQPLKNLLVGSSAKYIRASIDHFSADAVALDAGAMYIIPSQNLTLAAGIFNAGQATSAFIETKDDLPLNVAVGFSKRLAHLPLQVSFQLYKYRDEDWHGAFGGEFTLTRQLYLRLGYDNMGRNLEVDSSKDRFAGAAIGFGFLWSDIHLDYAFTSYGEIGSLNRFSISGQF
jgi:long-subunit fatty acid transport protein